MQKNYLMIANWKMNGTVDYLRSCLNQLASHHFKGCQLVMCLPAPYLGLWSYEIERLGKFNGVVSLGAQMIDPRHDGAFTGAFNARMLRDIGCDYVLIGHLERRRQFAESHEWIASQYLQAVLAGLKPVLCVSDQEDTHAARGRPQIEYALDAVFGCDGFISMPPHDIIVAYEPSSSIGGSCADFNHISAECAFIKKHIQTLVPEEFGAVTCCYGGGVDVEVMANLLQLPGLDGFLMGRLSLNKAKLLEVLSQCCIS